MRAVLVTGMLASGKSIALRVFQDLGYYCIDNLPPAMVEPFISLCKNSEPAIEKVAFVIDVRVESFFEDLDNAVAYLAMTTDFDILFVDADDQVLLSRYKLSRRRHLMSNNERIEETIKAEREKLADIRSRADYIVDTTDKKESAFKEELQSIFGELSMEKRFLINVVSFGFKHGILKDADTIFDARFLPNPYWVDELKSRSGLDPEVNRYVMDNAESELFLVKIIDMLEFLMPYYIKEGKTQFVLGIGCTGGYHRSVAIAEEIGKRLKNSDYIISVEHRDIEKG
mgnify:CR=1 FL=1